MTEIQLKENRTQKEFAFDERILMTQLESPQNLIQTEFPIKLNMIESRKPSFLMPVQRNVWIFLSLSCIRLPVSWPSFFCLKIYLNAYYVPGTMQSCGYSGDRARPCH